ncbi:hypothetical protein M427DRAFT_452585 [Gonapodya prolifera JEL478]|uniref:Uncharacterized protein n=1 Tax=Gonapodya prolifera (strain JEL478) TaxID=1344416 RepID=A0A139ASK7_GONPJ|nr:hypothetical protein M427DRAFT_452585 [Gonapodya prolifera JEL478]|eukprot:KXS19533.1 hypothetical protein M427DRAFT_452585 [Gonapodya prolifera JEL478]
MPPWQNLWHAPWEHAQHVGVALLQRAIPSHRPGSGGWDLFDEHIESWSRRNESRQVAEGIRPAMVEGQDNGGRDIPVSVELYLSDPNQASGIHVAAPLVIQKSYGNEKRFLVPAPKIRLSGPTWSLLPLRRSTDSDNGESTPLSSLGLVTCTATLVSALDRAPCTQSSIMGRGSTEESEDSHKSRSTEGSIGTSRVAPEDWELVEVSENGQHVEGVGLLKGLWWGVNRGDGEIVARVKVLLATGQMIGVLDSPVTRVISKASRSSPIDMKNAITPSSQVSLFNRTKSQSSSTRYLCLGTSLVSLLADGDRWDRWQIAPASWLPTSPSMTFDEGSKEDPNLVDAEFGEYVFEPPIGSEGDVIGIDTTVVLRHVDTGVTTARMIVRKVEGKHTVTLVGSKYKIEDNGAEENNWEGSEGLTDEPSDQVPRKSRKRPRKSKEHTTGTHSKVPTGKPAKIRKSMTDRGESSLAELHKIAFECDSRPGWFLSNTESGVRMVEGKQPNDNPHSVDIGEEATWFVAGIGE